MERIDTHQLVKDLIKSGLPEKSSEIIGKAFFSNNTIENFANVQELFRLEKEQHEVKIELAIVKLSNLEKEQTAIKTDITNMRTDITVIQQTMATETSLAKLKTELKTDIANMKADFLKWLISFLLGIVAINITTIGVVVSFLGK